MRVFLLERRAWVWVLFGVVGGAFLPIITVLLLLAAIEASVHEQVRGAWLAYLLGVALVVWMPLLIVFGAWLWLGPYLLAIECAAVLGLLVVELAILRERWGWFGGR
jgi:hypothetical protein